MLNNLRAYLISIPSQCLDLKSKINIPSLSLMKLFKLKFNHCNNYASNALCLQRKSRLQSLIVTNESDLITFLYIIERSCLLIELYLTLPTDAQEMYKICKQLKSFENKNLLL